MAGAGPQPPNAASGAGASSAPQARIEELDEIQKEVIHILENAGLALQEIGKDRPSQKATDGFVTSVMNNVKSVEAKLSDHIKYLTQVSTGESSFLSLLLVLQSLLSLLLLLPLLLGGKRLLTSSLTLSRFLCLPLWLAVTTAAVG